MGACCEVVLGCGLKYYAISTTFPEKRNLIMGFGELQVFLAALGYAILVLRINRPVSPSLRLS